MFHATEDCVESSEHDSTVALQVARHPSTASCLGLPAIWLEVGFECNASVDK